MLKKLVYALVISTLIGSCSQENISTDPPPQFYQLQLNEQTQYLKHLQETIDCKIACNDSMSAALAYHRGVEDGIAFSAAKNNRQKTKADSIWAEIEKKERIKPEFWPPCYRFANITPAKIFSGESK